jgi:hypothetical protein
MCLNKDTIGGGFINTKSFHDLKCVSNGISWNDQHPKIREGLIWTLLTCVL